MEVQVVMWQQVVEMTVVAGEVACWWWKVVEVVMMTTVLPSLSSSSSVGVMVDEGGYLLALPGYPISFLLLQ